ncbi:MAG TPA: dephospho-CoA kinase [Candidatus Dormibacteraeota bacterium]|jgi:dephospho-CoA kinase|nr:dephospho-CoA kinase [Candidatus Dormibacteraeota bacterium]
MRIIGLTGGIGSGKSTVTGMLRDLGAAVVDADEAAHAVLLPGSEGAEEVAAGFGPEVTDEAGRIDRQRLADIVFNDEAARARLNAIVHPRVQAWMAEAVAEAGRRGVETVVLDVPLLYENGLDAGTTEVWVVWVPEALQVARAVARGMREDDARARIAAQMPLEEKRRRAARVIDNSGSRDATRAQVRAAWRQWQTG